MQCTICRKECEPHEPMALVRVNSGAISKATEREPVCLIDYAVCPECADGWSKAFVKRQVVPMLFLGILMAIFIVLGLSTKIGWGMFIVAAVPAVLIALSLNGIIRHARKDQEEKARVVFCEFFFQKGGIPKQIIRSMPGGLAVKDVRIESRGSDNYMLMSLPEMTKYLSPKERASARSWK